MNPVVRELIWCIFSTHSRGKLVNQLEAFKLLVEAIRGVKIVSIKRGGRAKAVQPCAVGSLSE